MKPSVGKFIAGNACILVATIFWGVNVSFTKALIPQWMTSESISAVRLVGGCLLFWLASLFVRNARIDRADWKLILLGGVIGLFGFIYLFVMSLRYGNPIDISIIMTLPPMFVLLMGVLFRHARPSWIELAGVAVSFVGAVIVILDGNSGKAGSDNLLGDVLAVASCICYAFYLVILEQPTRKYPPVTLLRWVFLFSAIPGAFLAIGFDKLPILHASVAAPWLEIGFILLCPTFIAYFLVQPAIRSIGSELVSLYQYLLPVFATVSAVLMGLDTLRWAQVAAMAVIIAGMVLTNIGKRHRHS
ncbi:permeases of the drug/metabolite transporter (DMT) superfamily [Bacteroides sp. CAG:927]|jgi:drug/metabolite transporter (DMT)-like permease|nr:permeases of the drug/metabolite transporter (DMT) superfamily [Bacteroides sp. CAG:927]